MAAIDQQYEEYRRRSAERHRQDFSFKRNQFLSHERRRNCLKSALFGVLIGLIFGIWFGMAFFGCTAVRPSTISNIEIVKVEKEGKKSKWGDFTYDCIVDPAVVFKSWPIIKKNPTGLNQGYAMYKNPTGEEPYVVCLVFSNRWLMGVLYILGDKTYTYEYDFKTKHFGLKSSETLGKGV